MLVKIVNILFILENIFFFVYSADEAFTTTKPPKPVFSFFFKTLGQDDLASNNQQSGPFFNYVGKDIKDFANSFKQENSFMQNIFSLPTVSPQVSAFDQWKSAISNQQQPTSIISDEAETHLEEDTKDCELSITTVNGRRACKGKTIFTSDFRNFDKYWSHEVYIPSYQTDTSDPPFNFFDKNGTRVKQNGELVITPVVMNDSFVRRGKLKLEDCTGKTDEECEKSAHFQWILPPVSSSRITTKNSFSFKYGTIEIKAKFPKGDWLIPELWLEPKLNKYGNGLESGRIVTAMARGNRELNYEGVELDYRVLESSLLMSSNGKIRSRTMRIKTEEPWQAHFHTYKFIWRPDGFSLFVNGVQLGQLVQKNFSETLASMVGFDHDEQKRWFSGSALAPFDQEFFVSLGLSVGGRDFPDESVSGKYKKPWKSRTVKEMLDFYKARDKWEKSWHDTERKTLTIQKVKITAL